MRRQVGDAVRLVQHESAALLGGPFDVILEDFAYEAHGLLSVDFWRSLRERCATPGATLFVNTLYPRAEDLDALESDLHRAGWLDVQRRVDRGLQAAPGEAASQGHLRVGSPFREFLSSRSNSNRLAVRSG